MTPAAASVRVQTMTHSVHLTPPGLDDEIELTNKAVVDGCNHAFCLACLRDWIRYKPEQPLCPLCKRAIAGYTHGYGKLNHGASKRPRVEGAGTADQPFELLDDDDAPGPSSQPDSGEFCVEHTVVQPQPNEVTQQANIQLAILGLHQFLSASDMHDLNEALDMRAQHLCTYLYLPWMHHAPHCVSQWCR